MRLFQYDVSGGDFTEPVSPHHAPVRDEPSFSKNQRVSRFWARVVWYRNQFTPPPEAIPPALRIKQAANNPVVNRQGQQAMRNTGGITRVIPQSYSAQIMGQ
jgi:hypothetical protein